MCLHQDTAKTKAWIAKHGHKKSVPVYKCLYFYQFQNSLGDTTGEIRVRSRIQAYPYSPGVHKSDSRQRVALSERSTWRTIHVGVHAHVSRESSKMSVSEVVFRADPKDLIAVGRYGDIVFRKITLTKQSYDSAIRRWKKYYHLK